MITVSGAAGYSHALLQYNTDSLAQALPLHDRTSRADSQQRAITRPSVVRGQSGLPALVVFVLSTTPRGSCDHGA